ncbi:MAG: hypothetical protein ACI8PB_004389 [Desulforhopalus sp.]|jgi:hypothetical protein
MITDYQKNAILDNMIKLLELPDSAYEKARKRYEDLGEWFDRKDSIIAENKPHIFPQGSFRLGTAIRPLDEREEYDLDLACKLLEGISKDSHSQQYLKKIVGEELELYRAARGIQEKLEAKHRCWRLEYQDDLSFHMDIVPCIPADEIRRKTIQESLRNEGLGESFSLAASNTTVSITDDRHECYTTICGSWKISNPEGYAIWFEDRINTSSTGVLLEKAQVDALPVYKQKTPLQRVAQILKRHRDNWSKDNPESKPISIIITTLAARAYNGESDTVQALNNILEKMGGLVRASKPRVPNPVDPEEDFADRWYRADSAHLRLEDNFNMWLLQARKDLQHITSTEDMDLLCELVEDKFSLRVNKSELTKQLGFSVGAVVLDPPKVHVIKRDETARPWRP